MLLGVTGSFGSGKTFVASLLRKAGAGVIDADNIAHKVIMPSGDAYKRVVAIFGKGIIGRAKRIDRRKLGSIVFRDKAQLFKLVSILHPEVIKAIKSRIASHRKRIVVVDAPLLLEAGLKCAVDKVIVVTITRQEQLERLRQKTQLSTKEMLARIRRQMPLSLKVREADFIIDNSGTKAETKKQVKKVWEVLSKSIFITR